MIQNILTCLFVTSDYFKMLRRTNEDEVIGTTQCSLKEYVCKATSLFNFCTLIDSDCHSSTDQNSKELNTYKMIFFKEIVFRNFNL